MFLGEAVGFTYNKLTEATKPPPKRRKEMAKRLYRSTTQKMLAGVCGGLAEYFDADVSLVRLLTVGLALVTAVLPMFFFYIIAWIVIPQGQPAKQA
jgi:phage shock protein C